MIVRMSVRAHVPARVCAHPHSRSHAERGGGGALRTCMGGGSAGARSVCAPPFQAPLRAPKDGYLGSGEGSPHAEARPRPRAISIPRMRGVEPKRPTPHVPSPNVRTFI